MEASGPAWSARGYSALFCHRGRLDDVDMVDVVYRLAKDRGGQEGTDRTKELEVRRKRSQQSCNYDMYVQCREQTIQIERDVHAHTHLPLYADCPQTQ